MQQFSYGQLLCILAKGAEDVSRRDRSRALRSDPGEGEAHWLLGMLEVVKVCGADTGGEFGLLEVTVRAGEGSPWHVHRGEDEWFYVLEGEFTVWVGDTKHSLTPGSFAFGPRGVPHTFYGETDGAKVLIGFFRSISKASCARWASSQPSACCLRPGGAARHAAVDGGR